MSRKQTTAALSKMLERDVLDKAYWASEVTIDYMTEPKRVDYMAYRPQNQTVSGIEKGHFTVYEVKSCVEDFRSKNGHNFIAEKNYYVMPLDVYEKVKDEVPYGVGVYCQHASKKYLTCVKQCKRRDRKHSMSQLLFFMLRSGK